jgi:hypothetical protein
VSGRPVGLSVKQPSALTLVSRFPSGLRLPLRASVTLWEATAPVKLPARHCPQPRFHRPRLEFSDLQGGISTTTPPELASQLQSLPPILHSKSKNPMPSCSKGSRGLSVLSRVGGIFTPYSISLSTRQRQRTSRYAIRAGRNLPDKEFRYLRTVIVTAAVYWGFNSSLRLATKPSF